MIQNKNTINNVFVSKAMDEGKLRGCIISKKCNGGGDYTVAFRKTKTWKNMK